MDPERARLAPVEPAAPHPQLTFMALRPTPLTPTLPFGRDPAAVRARIEMLERLMEGLVRVPGTNRRLGLDVILDLVPFAGSTVAAGMGAYLAWEARNLGMSKIQIARMGGNVGVDWLLGLIPWIGAIPDFFFRSNTRNLRMVKRYIDRHHPAGAIV
jgi:hypothetical protein